MLEDNQFLRIYFEDNALGKNIIFEIVQNPILTDMSGKKIDFTKYDGISYLTDNKTLNAFRMLSFEELHIILQKQDNYLYFIYIIKQLRYSLVNYCFE